MKKLAMLLAVLMATLSLSALADVQKGDRNEEVRYLQWLLKQNDWLGDNPDGVFGNRTEQAVMDCQTALGMEATGIADAALMQALEESRVRRDKALYGQDYYEPYNGGYAPELEAGYDAPAHCQTVTLDGLLYRDSCREHLGLLAREYALTVSGEAADYAAAAELWREDIDRQFEDWITGAPLTYHLARQAAKAAWEDCFSRQQATLNALLNDPVLAERQTLLFLKYYAGALCELISGELPVAVASPLFAEGETAPEARCEAWSVNGGTEFVTACASHAPLFAAERARAAENPENGDALEAVVADWESALNALYDRWEAGVDAESVPLVQSARDAFFAALDAQDDTADPGLTRPARLRVIQLETARLCELLD